MKKITDKITNYHTEFGIVSLHECINHNGAANTQFKPYSYQYWTATKENKTSPHYFAKGYAINWLKRFKVKK